MNEEQSVTELLKRLRDDSTMLIRDEVELAKTEMREKASVYSRNAISLVAGGLVAYSALVILLIGLGSLITEWLLEGGMDPAMAHFVGMAIVAIVVGIIGAVMISKALHKLRDEGLVPQRTVETLKNDKQWAKQQVGGHAR